MATGRDRWWSDLDPKSGVPYSSRVSGVCIVSPPSFCNTLSCGSEGQPGLVAMETLGAVHRRWSPHPLSFQSSVFVLWSVPSSTLFLVGQNPSSLLVRWLGLLLICILSFWGQWAYPVANKVLDSGTGWPKHSSLFSVPAGSNTRACSPVRHLRHSLDGGNVQRKTFLIPFHRLRN